MSHTLFDSVDTAEQSLLEQALTQAVATHGLDMAMVSHFFDARHLPCPMPLLKAKLSLRSVADGKALYLIATDKNSQHDLVAFCQKNGHTVHAWQSEQGSSIIYHFIIIKN
ncbi:sulfurtransferase TusA family protein [Moraxella sp. FZLJ2107]|uniref:sulfurtransferase TusA family protein n=1 Tax=unclassified Moraxella TaxID=2685852 RepID=UPI0020C8B665|nr:MULTISPECIES: sulfurtransferase TusA family protein [unclassified Moraxella]UTO06034.1 sulfurtransferase TusA family protein [Moraxella sp. FZLJ2107]UTO22771.1 sulfurtransferase TusA family protein [Moraxella sp. FZLJ2109]